MRADDAHEFARGDDFGFLPELWEMALIASDQAIRAGGVGGFDENVIGGIGSDLKRAKGRDEMGAALQELKKLLREPFANVKLRAKRTGRKHRASRMEEKNRPAALGMTSVGLLGRPDLNDLTRLNRFIPSQASGDELQ